jgi:voltage-gated potassium channel
VVSVVLMISGFLLLSLVSAALASLFVRNEEAPVERRELRDDAEILGALASILERIDAIERRLPPEDRHEP